MPFPKFNMDGVIPPFVGPNGPGGHSQDITPYESTSIEVVSALSNSQSRRNILKGWLAHRVALRNLGIISGFQWLDGSFVENKEPKDLDVVTFLRRPTVASTLAELQPLMQQNRDVFCRSVVKTTYHLDAFFIDMDAKPETIVDHTRYWLGLFSHRRVDNMWKGMLKVDLNDNGNDSSAHEILAVTSLTD